LKTLIFAFLLLFVVDASAISFTKIFGMSLTKSGTKTTLNLSKNAGSSAVGGKTTPIGKALFTEIDIPPGHKLGLMSLIPPPTVVDKIIGNKLVIPTLITTVVGVACQMFCEDIKDWIKGGALSLDKDGNFLKGKPSTEVKPISEPCSSGYVNCGVTDVGCNGAGYCNHLCAYVSCDSPVTPPYSKIPDSEAATILKNTPTPDPQFQKLVEDLYKLSKDRNDPTIEPEADEPEIQDTGLPSSTELPPTEEVTPDGKITKKQDTIKCSKTGSRTLECEKETKTKTENADGTIKETTTYNAPTANELSVSELADIDYCKVHPTILACIELGDVPPKETIPTNDIPISLNPTSLGSGSCPAPKVMTIQGKTITMSYQPQCDFATKINPLIIAFSWLAAGFIVVGSIKDS
jgi:hypothetical protein